MILIGMFDSPFVRRVAVTMNLLKIPFEHRNWSVGKDFDRIREFNPLGRVPTLVLDDGESLIESAAILDYLDDLVIPAAEANLISYLWPVMIVGIGAMLGLFRLRPRQIVGLGLGFAGAVILMGGGAMALSLEGMALALLSGVSWALYCIFRLKWKAAAGPVLTRGCALSTGLCLGLHLLLEPTVMPSAGGIAAAAAVGIVPLAFGNLLWDEGFRRGDGQLLAVMAYATPLCSALLLAVFGLESLTCTLGVGALVIVAAGLLSRSD
jgi:drug/metabolite transporter (DMT)-like permease